MNEPNNAVKSYMKTPNQYREISKKESYTSKLVGATTMIGRNKLLNAE